MASLAETQYGLVSVRQLRSFTTRPSWARNQVKAARMAVVRRGVLRVTGHPVHPRAVAMAAVLACERPAYVSHRTAAWLHGYERVLPEPVEITVFFGHAPLLADVIVHESWVHHPVDLVVVDGVPVTSPARTVVDCARPFSPYLLARLIDHLRRTDRLDLRDLRTTFDRLAGRGRHGTPVLRELLVEREEGLRPGDSDLEVDFVRPIVAAGLPSPEQNATVDVGGGVRFAADLLWREAKVIVDVNGFAAHRERTSFDAGSERTILLEGAGYRVVPVTSRTRVPIVIRTLRSLLDASVPENASRG